MPSIIKTYPLKAITLEEAQEKQFELVDIVGTYFNNNEFFNMGDVGLHPSGNAPQYTKKVEETLASYFKTEACLLVRGAGTGALRYALYSIFNAGDKILLHNAPIYPTTAVSIDKMGLLKIECDFNNLEDIEQTVKNHPDIKGSIVQISRQQLEDKYESKDVIRLLKKHNIKVITDDNYSVMKVSEIGVEQGATLSTFSLFKLLGLQGIGCILGNRELIAKIKEMNYSGGCAVQGFEALECLRALVYAPLALATQAQVLDTLVETLNNGEITEIESVVIANAQSRVLLVQFKEPIAKEIIKVAAKFGAATYPVGSESKYEILPMIYRVSGTLLKSNPIYAETLIRINPMRAGAKTIINILKQSLMHIKNQNYDKEITTTKER